MRFEANEEKKNRKNIHIYQEHVSRRESERKQWIQHLWNIENGMIGAIFSDPFGIRNGSQCQASENGETEYCFSFMCSLSPDTFKWDREIAIQQK